MNYILVQIFFFLLQFNIEFNEVIDTNKNSQLKKEQKSEIIILNDNNFHTFVKDGRDNRWLIIFFSQSCYYCNRAIQILNNILYKNQFKSVNNIKFGKIDISINTKVNFRFNISEVPYIALIDNNSMIELNLYPNEKNLLNFIESNLSQWKNKFNIPKNNLLKYYYMSFDNSISIFVNNINNFLKSRHINYSMNSIVFMLLYIVLCIIFWAIIFKGCIICIICCGHKKKEDSNNNINNEEINDKNNVEENINDKDEKDKSNNNRRKNYHSKKRKSKKN